jgi:hypothetical protein
VFLEIAMAWARIDYIGEQTGVEPILHAGIELEVMVADSDSSNFPPGSFEDPTEYCAPNVQE